MSTPRKKPTQQEKEPKAAIQRRYPDVFSSALSVPICLSVGQIVPVGYTAVT